MEYWELVKDDIDFDQLYKDTCCTPELIVKLKGRRLLTTQEEDKLFAVREGYLKSYKLYKILQTRKGSYETVMEVLLELCQTGAWEILNNAVAKYKEVQLLLERQGRVDLLPNARIQLNSARTTILKAIPGFSKTDALKILDDPDLSNEFSTICQKGHPFINLDPELPKPPKLYIPRLICNRLVLYKSAFRMNGIQDVFVVKGLNRIDLDKLVEPSLTVSSSKYRGNSPCRHIYLEADEHWDDLTRVCKSPMHLVNYESGQLILLQSSAVTEVILQHSSNKSRESDAYSSEDVFIGQLMSNHKSKGALICDVPGMGKTLLMESLANKLAKMHTNCIVFFVQLSTLCETLTTVAEVPIGYEALGFALKQVCASKLAAWILEQYMQVSESLIYFFMDGFDEIRENLIETTTAFLAELNKTRTVQLIISSRPHLRLHLEKTFNLLSYDILPFCKKDQIHAIVSQWVDASPLASRDNLEIFAEQCIKTLNKFQNDDGSEILGIPLKCYLLGTVYKTKIKESTQKQHRLSVIQELEIKSIRSLYDHFVAEGISKACKKQLTQEMEDKILNYHTLEALKLLFPDIAHTYAEIMGFPMESVMRKEVLRAGIMSAVNSSKLHFVHRTLAEYFVGRFFAEYWMHKIKCDPLMRATLEIYYLEHVVRTKVPENQNCRGSPCANMEWTLESFSTRSLKPCYFNFLTVLWFQEDISSDTEYGQDFLLHLIEDTSIPVHVLLHYQDHLSSFTNRIIKACIDAGFASILRLIVKMYQCLLPNNSLREMLRDHDHIRIWRGHGDEDMAYILCSIAYKGRPAIGKILVSMFGPPNRNYIMRDCSNFPVDLMSPVDVAIDVNDMDAFLYFVKLVPLPWERILLRLLLRTEKKKEALDVRLQMFVALTSSEHHRELSKVTLQDFKVHLETVSDRNNLDKRYAWVKFAYKFDVSLKGLHLKNKVTILKNAITELDDAMILQLLMVLFGNYTSIFADSMANSTTCMGADIGGPDYVLSEAILQDIDREDAERTLNCVPFHRYPVLRQVPFANVQNLETLKIFAKICCDTTKQRHHECKYLSLAVYKGNTEWVNYLIESGHYYGFQKNNGNSPLHDLSGENSVEITRLLVKKGANIYELNEFKKNVAHIFLSNCSRTDAAKEQISRWVTYTLEEEYTQLWSMEDSGGKTPFANLIDLVGPNHPTSKALLSHYKDLRFLSASSKRVLLEHSFKNDNDNEIIGLLLKLFRRLDKECVDQAETVNILDSLDINDAKEVTGQTNFYFNYDYFRNAKSTETLKILTAIFSKVSDGEQTSFLHLSTIQGKPAWVTYLIEKGFDLNGQDNYQGNTPLHLVPCSHSLEMAELILKSGADLFAVNNCKENIAHRVVDNIIDSDSLTEWVTFIIQNFSHALWNMKNINGHTPFQLLIDATFPNDAAVAIVKSYDTSLKLLPDKNKRLLLQEYIVEKPDEEILELLKELFGTRLQFYKEQSNIEVTTDDAGQLPKKADFKIDSNEFLSELDLDEAKKTFEDLYIGVRNRIENIETIKVLVTLHKTSKSFNGKKQCYLHRAVAFGRVDMVEYLILSGYDVNMQDADGKFPIHHVTTNRPLEVFRVLVKNGAHVYAVDKDEWNVARHLVYETVQNENRTYILHEWAAYTLENGFIQLWNVESISGLTPFQVLSEEAGSDHPTTKLVSSKLQTLESLNSNLTT